MVTKAAVSAVILRNHPLKPWKGKNGIEILLGKRGKYPGKGFWSLPGGSIFMMESVTEAAEREVWEETGLKREDIHITAPFAVTTVKSPPKYHYIISQVIVLVNDGVNYEKASDDLIDIQWVSVDKVMDQEWQKAHKVSSQVATVVKKALNVNIDLAETELIEYL